MYAKPLRERLGGKGAETPQAVNRRKVSRKLNERIKVMRTNPSNLPRPKQGRKRISNVQALHLEYVFGYRGFDCNSNVHYVNDGTEIVFHTAGTGIVLNLSSGHQRFYLEHSDDILCLVTNVNPRFAALVASAQIDVHRPTIHIWNVNTMKTVSIVQTEHSKGLNCLSFSPSGKYLLSVGIDDDKTLSIWKWQDGSLIASGRGHTNKICDAKFRPDSDADFVTVGIKHIKFWKICGGQLVSKKGVLNGVEKAKMHTMLSIGFAPEALTYTGCVTGDIYVWKHEKLQRFVSKAHNGPIFSMFTCLGDGLIVTGAKENKATNSACVKLWDQQLSRSRSFPIQSLGVNLVKSVCRQKDKIVIGTKSCDIIEVQEQSGAPYFVLHSHADGELWGLACHPNKDLVATASYDRTLRLWDLNKKVACKQPPALKTVICVNASEDRFENDSYYEGGCVINNGLPLECARMFGKKAQPPDPRFFRNANSWKAEWKRRLERSTEGWTVKKLRHQTKSFYWKHGSINEDYSKIDCPVLLIGGLADGYASSTLRLASNLNEKCRAVVGLWAHNFPDLSNSGSSIDFLNLCLNWWQYNLKGTQKSIQNVMHWPKLRVFVKNETNENDDCWFSLPRWSQNYQLFQRESICPNVKSLSLSKDLEFTETQNGYEFGLIELKAHVLQGLNAGEWCPKNEFDHAGDQTTSNSQSICFVSRPLEQDLILGGFGKLHLDLILANTGIHGIAARLCHQKEDGTNVRISYGLVNLGRNCNKFEKIQATIDLKPNFCVIPAGDRLYLAISPCYFPLMSPMPQVQGIWMRPYNSRLLLQTLTHDDLNDKTSFNPAIPLLTMETIYRNENPRKPYEYKVITNKEGGAKFITVFRLPKLFYPELNLEFGEICTCTYSLCPCCREGESLIEQTFEIIYPELSISVKIDTVNRLKYTSETFDGTDYMKVMLNDEPFFERNDRYSVPRNAA